MCFEIRRDLEQSLRITFNTEPRHYEDMHQVMKEQLSIDNKHAAIRMKRYRAHKKIRDEDTAWRTQLLEIDIRRRQNLNNWDETWQSGGTPEAPWHVLEVDKRLKILESEQDPSSKSNGEPEEGADSPARTPPVLASASQVPEQRTSPESSAVNQAPEQRRSSGANEREAKSARLDR